MTTEQDPFDRSHKAQCDGDQVHEDGMNDTEANDGDGDAGDDESFD